MSLTTKATNGNDSVDASFLTSNHKVMHYLRNSTRCSTNNSLHVLHKTSSHTHDLFNAKDTSMNNSEQSQHRIRSCSEECSSSSSVINTLSRSNFSLGSSLSDPGVYYNGFSSNTSSSGICSTFSDVGHEEGTSTSSEELDFNLGFDQISDNDDIEVANLDEIDEDDEYEHNEGENQRISTKNSDGKLKYNRILCFFFFFLDSATILNVNESNLDARISELEEFLRKSYSSANIDDYEFNNDDTITANQTKQQQRASFLHDSTYTLCAHDCFSAYTEDDDHENGIGMRSNSLGIVPLDRKAALLVKAPKKAVRFADMLVCFVYLKIR
jgi:hypothetical protein